ncbi:hypothetical protein Vadar_003117 [Vaccinium darrowii]|uniref:Uncharacterized protein n=1 Tax=Vaccinium darrowii TaxID=229202 RepID=A0ACB7Y4G6_9ERIC|nr:hypothetical protein Vadar_003117 [Vaccinium darrowii]
MINKSSAAPATIGGYSTVISVNLMDTDNRRPAPGGGEPTMDTGDWRSRLQPHSRQRIADELTNILKRHIPFSGQEGLQELEKIAVRFEERIYTCATSQPDYLKKISLQMLTIEAKSQNTKTNSLPSNSGNDSKNPLDTGSLGNHGRSLPIPMATNQVQAHQQLISQNIQDNMGATAVQGSANLASAFPNIGGLPPTTMPNVVGQNSNLQNIDNVSAQNSIGNSVGQGESSNIFASTQRQMPCRQQVVPQQQQSQNPQQQLLQQQLMKQKYQKGSIPDTKMQSQLQQQQAQQHRQKQNQQPSVQQSTQSMLLQNPQAVLRQQQQHSSIIHQQQTPLQQQQLVGQQSNSMIMQQNQIVGQQNSIADVQHQQRRLLSQRNSLTNNLLDMHQKQQQQQQQLLVNQSGNSSMQTAQHSVHMLQQSKIPLQQQNHQSAATLLPAQGQQSEPQQQLLSQIQSQPGELQQQALQQPNSLQHDMQQRLQTSGPSLQSQNMIDQQKQLFQSQIAIPEVSLTSLDSTAQIGNENSGDWQEEIYQKIKVMKEAYLLELIELDQKIAGKLQQQLKHEQWEKLKSIKTMLEHILQFLQVPKSSILPNFKEKVGACEKQIVNFLNSHRLWKPASLQQGQQIPPPHIQSIQLSQQSQSQITQAHPMHENQINPHQQSMKLPGSSVARMQQNNVTSLQHNPLSSLSGVPTISQSTINSLQPASTIDSVQGSALNELQQVAVGTLKQNHVNALQQADVNSLSSHSGMNVLQPNLTPRQSNSNMLQNQHLKQQEQQMLQTQQKQQLLHQQKKQQQNVQLQPHQMAHLPQMNDANDWKMRQPMGAKTGVFQQHCSTGQRLAYHHQQLKSDAQFPISSSQLLQAASPQMPQHPSPQMDQQNLLTSIAKAGPFLQSASSPFIVSSPSTPIAPSTISVDFEKLNSGVSALSDTGNISHHQTAGGVLRGQSLSIGTPEISASPLLAEFTSPDGNHGNASAVDPGKSRVTEQPFERFLKVVKSMSPTTLSASVSDIDSVVSMIDRIAGSAPCNGSKTVVGEDLVAMTKWRLQERNMSMQDTNIRTRKLRCYTSAMPLNVVSSAGSANDSFKHFTCSETSDSESTATSSVKRPRFEANHALLKEIMEINQRLIDTVVCVSDEDVDPTPAAAITGEGGEGTIVLCSFSAVALCPSLKSQYASAQMSPIQPLRLLVPTSYPSSSPIMLDKFPFEVSKECDDLSLNAKSRFSISLRNHSQHISLGEIAKTWDACARAVILEYAQRNGGGSFSTIYGMQEERRREVSFDELVDPAELEGLIARIDKPPAQSNPISSNEVVGHIQRGLLSLQ